VLVKVGLPSRDVHDARPGVGDVRRRAPHMADAAGPLPRLVARPLADREDHRPPRRADGLGPLRIRGASAEAGGVAPVDLHEVDAPVRETLCVTCFVAKTGRIALARARPGVGVETEAQPAAMDLVSEIAHAARECPAVLNEVTVVISRALVPCVVDDDVAVTGVAHPALDERVCGLEDETLRDERAEPVPRVPAHRRRRREPIGEDTETHARRLAAVLRQSRAPNLSGFRRDRATRSTSRTPSRSAAA